MPRKAKRSKNYYIDDEAGCSDDATDSDNEISQRPRRKRKTKAKTKKQLKEEAMRMEAERTVYTLDECLYADVLESLLCLEEARGSWSAGARALFCEFKQNKSKTFNSSIMVHYKRPKYMNDIKSGRVYAYPSIQNLPGRFTRLTCHGLYRDIDIRKCAPTCLLYIATQLLDMQPAVLSAYVADPQGYAERLRVKYEVLREAPMEMIKKVFNVVMHGGSYKSVARDYNIEITEDNFVEEFEQFHNEMYVIASKAESHPEFVPILQVLRENNKDKSGTFIAFIWQHIEGKILEHLVEYFTKYTDTKPGVLKHDGLMVNSSKPIEPDVLRAAEAFVLDHVSVEITLVEKSLEPTREDIEFSRGPKLLYMLSDTTSQAMHIISRYAYTHKHVRLTTFKGKKILDGISPVTCIRHNSPEASSVNTWCIRRYLQRQH